MSSLHPSLPNTMGYRRAASISDAVHISSIGATYHLQTSQVDQAFIMAYAEGERRWTPGQRFHRGNSVCGFRKDIPMTRDEASPAL
jgi:hypothetical protein